MKKRRFKFPIEAKIALMMFLFAAVLVEVAMTFFSLLSSEDNRRDYENRANNISSTVATVIDADAVEQLKTKVQSIVDASKEKPLSDEWGSERWNAYIAQFKSVSESTEFKSMQTYLRDIASVNSADVDCIYLSYVDSKNEFFVYLCDSAPDDDACPPGCLDPIYEINRGVLTDPNRGFPAYVTHTQEYGYLVTSGAPVQKGNEVVGYVCVDVSMERVRAHQRDTIIQMFVYMASAALIATGLSVVIAHFVFVRPISKLKKAASSYHGGDNEEVHQRFASLQIKTRDEIEELADSMKSMENDVHEKITELTAANAALIASQQETMKMKRIADTDALTGLNSKSAYNHEVDAMEKDIASGELKEFGIVMIDLNYLKSINDEKGHIAGDRALICLATTIRAVYTRSPIYRVGGDEFVVILRGADYRKRNKLAEQFKAKIEEIKHNGGIAEEERISAAIGFAVYDPTVDKNVDDVFQRADETMYRHKHRMKEEDHR